jgi:hypothetical protein
LRSELEARNILLKENSAQYEKDLDVLEHAIKVKNEEIRTVESLLNRQIDNL